MAEIFRDFAKITNQLIVGKHPGTVGDIDTLYVNHGVRAIENLQESWEDQSYIAKITERCELKRIWYQRVPVGFLNNRLQHFQITQMNHVKKLYYLKEIYSRVMNYQSSVV
jgi:hypothetical protein